MRLSHTYLNERIEMFDGVYDSERERQLRTLSRLYNRHLGPITQVHLERPDLLDPAMYCGSCNHLPMSAVIPDLTVRPSAGDTMSIPGGGKGAGIQQPLLGAMGELAERLFAILHFQAIVDEVEFGSWQEMCKRGHRALGPDELHLFADEQYQRPGFGFVPFRAETPLRWIRASFLVTGEPVWIPAQLVLLYYKRAVGEVMIGYPTSGGLGFHTNPRRAMLHALYEYIERDAVNVRWYCRLAPTRVKFDLRQFLASQWHLRHTRIITPSLDGIEVFLNTLDVPLPIFTVTTRDHARSERMFLGGGGAWSNRDRALGQALFELGQTRAVLNSYKPGFKHIRPDSDITEMTDFLDGAVYFGYPENLPRLSWYTSGPEMEWDDVPSMNFADEDAEYAWVVEWLRTSGLNPIVIDMNNDCWPGASVVRTIVPELTPACVAAHAYLGHPRYYQLPLQLGASDHRLAFAELNPDPIPFP
jgi:ribosomal protein S12 methylthiotransferase accessory factor